MNNFCEFQCPQCGEWSSDESLLERGSEEYNYGKAIEFGGTPLDWTERHQCLSCGTEYEFENSNC